MPLLEQGWAAHVRYDRAALLCLASFSLNEVESVALARALLYTAAVRDAVHPTIAVMACLSSIYDLDEGLDEEYPAVTTSGPLQYSIMPV